MMHQPSNRAARIAADDRSWFLRHPRSVIRFRPMRTNEFESLKSHGSPPPAFKPSWCKADVVLEHVAVIDLTHLLQSGAATACSGGTLRIRVVTLKTRSRKAMARLQEELIEAICKELLILHKPMQADLQNKRGREQLKSAA